MRSKTRVVGSLLTLIAALCGTDASAQTVTIFADLPQRVKVGDMVAVLDDQGHRIRGRLLALTVTDMVVRAQPQVTFGSGSVVQVDRCCDPLREGALTGFAVGGVLGFLMIRGLAESNGAGLGGALVFGGIFAGIGAGVDAVIRTDVPVYRTKRGSVRLRLGDGPHGLRATVSVSSR